MLGKPDFFFFLKNLMLYLSVDTLWINNDDDGDIKSNNTYPIVIILIYVMAE